MTARVFLGTLSLMWGMNCAALELKPGYQVVSDVVSMPLAWTSGDTVPANKLLLTDGRHENQSAHGYHQYVMVRSISLGSLPAQYRRTWLSHGGADLRYELVISHIESVFITLKYCFYRKENV